jgi:uncharacterized protein (TIGR03437 family)
LVVNVCNIPYAIAVPDSGSRPPDVQYLNKGQDHLAMMHSFCRLIAGTVLALSFPIAALANLTQTNTLPANTALNLDTGATAATGGDILWDGSTIAPQGIATAVVIYKDWPASAFGTITSILVQVFPGYSKSVIPAASLSVGTVFGVHTNGGHWTKVIVLDNTGGSINLEFTTFGVTGDRGGGTPGPPTITSVTNNSSLIAAGLPNYGIAPSSIFVIVGTGLADPGKPVLQSSAAPGIPLELNGASISVVVGGVTTHPGIYYTSPTQIAGVLPAATPIGSGTLTVTYKGVASNAAPIEVVPSALGINTYYANTGVATDGRTGALITYTNSGTPGQTIVLWTTGLGADPADSDTIYTTTPHAVATPLQIYIGGVLATIRYQGASGYPGVNQINVVIPDSVPEGCWIALAAVAGGVVSNIATLPITRGGGACTDVVTGLKGDAIAATGGRTLRTGLVGLIQTDRQKKNGTHTIENSADAAFEKYAGVYAPANSVSPGGCIVNDLTPVNVDNTTGMDPGTITLTGSSALSVTLATQLGIKGAYYANLPSGAIPLTGGTFTFTGSGGADVGPFTSTITFTNPTLTWTNKDVAATVDRSKDLTITWTGGNPGSYVFITGTSAAAATSSLLGIVGGFTCLTYADAGHFTVPSYILSSLPAGNGGTEVQNDVYAPLPASGLDMAFGLGVVSSSVAGTYK